MTSILVWVLVTSVTVPYVGVQYSPIVQTEKDCDRLYNALPAGVKKQSSCVQVVIPVGVQQK